MPVDILLDSGGDILVNDAADITPQYSIRQDVKIRLQWFFAEWRFAPEYGVPYFDEVFVKNPNTELFALIIRAVAENGADFTVVKFVRFIYDENKPNAAISFTIITEYETFTEEVKIDV